LGPQGIQCCFGQVTFLDGENLLGARLAITQFAFRGEVKLDMVAVMGRVGRGDCRANGGVFPPADAFELVFEDGGFSSQLRFVDRCW
jgi:hypothetical protein